MKNKKMILWITLILIAINPVFAQNANDFKTNGKGTITKYEGRDNKIVIPAKIGNEQITAIGYDAFRNMELTSVTLPTGIKNIGREAFAKNKITTLTIPDNVTVEELAFIENQLTSLTIGNNCFIKNFFISDVSLFQERNNLKNVSLGTNIHLESEAVNWYLFLDYYCNNRKAGTYDASVKYTTKEEGDYVFFETKYGVVIDRYKGNDGSRLIIPGKLGTSVVKGINTSAFASKNVSLVQLPDSLIFISKGAFSNNQLTSVTIPKNIIYIGESAFSNNKLTSTIIPNSVTYIGNSAFSGNKLTSVTIGNSVTFIGNSAFSDNKLITITIPNSVTYIGDSAFSVNQLTSVTIPNSVASILDSAFFNNKLTSVTIPDSVTYIGRGLFYGNQLTSVTIPDSVTYIGDSAFYGNKLTSVTIPDSVTFIGGSAFYGNQLTSVIIGNSVTYIGRGTFSRNQLTSITIPNSVTYIGNEAFSSEVTHHSDGSVAFYYNPFTNVIFEGTISSDNIRNAFNTGDLLEKYLAGGKGTYIKIKTYYDEHGHKREEWAKQ